MLDPPRLEDLARRLSSALPPGAEHLRDDVRRNMRAVLESALSRMDLVTREEFDVQCAVLRRARERLAALERRVAELEAGQASAQEPAADEPSARRSG